MSNFHETVTSSYGTQHTFAYLPEGVESTVIVPFPSSGGPFYGWLPSIVWSGDQHRNITVTLDETVPPPPDPPVANYIAVRVTAGAAFGSFKYRIWLTNPLDSEDVIFAGFGDVEFVSTDPDRRY